MKHFVHYLRAEEVAEFPAEFGNEPHVAVDGFYLLGTTRDDLADKYTFHAVHGDRIVETALERYRKSSAFLRATVDGVGAFLFHAQVVPHTPAYIGNETLLSGLIALRRLRSWRPNDLDEACRQHEFYFVGYSHRIR